MSVGCNRHADSSLKSRALSYPVHTLRRTTSWIMDGAVPRHPCVHIHSSNYVKDSSSFLGLHLVRHRFWEGRGGGCMWPFRQVISNCTLASVRCKWLSGMCFVSLYLYQFSANWACFTWKGALEIRSLLLLLFGFYPWFDNTCFGAICLKRGTFRRRPNPPTPARIYD